jgi:hypothetical protein
VTTEQVLYDYSWTNLTLYSAATPQFDDEDTKAGGKEWDESKDANNPDNFNDKDDEEETIVRSI